MDRPTAVTGARRQRLEQLLVLAVPVLLIAWLAANTAANLKAKGVTTGFGFLAMPARMGISEGFLPFVAGVDSYARVVAIGLCNTLFVSVLAIGIATVIGTAVGLSRLSGNWLLSRCAGTFVELVRNVPLPLQLLLWYQTLLNLPSPRTAIQFGGAYLSNRGLFFPTVSAATTLWLVAALLLAVTLLVGLRAAGVSRRGWRRRLPALALSVVGAAAVLLAIGEVELDRPTLRGFNFSGGMAISPELAALVLGLSIYAAAFVAEIVRASVVSVPRGQWEAGRALGLPHGRILRKIILPQALRLGLPALGNEYLSTIKNSSLAVIIGYPELASLINTMASDTGQPIEAIAVLMVSYLTISLGVGWLLHRCEQRLALAQR
ncbi:MAG TPA: ABC transporter permease subunit [Bosea sp. (in: a-proteobacteria)]|nr:ABC transporter permease subunit [Bosea sp. (in: a-proteobacteria)]